MPGLTIFNKAIEALHDTVLREIFDFHRRPGGLRMFYFEVFNAIYNAKRSPQNNGANR